MTKRFVTILTCITLCYSVFFGTTIAFAATTPPAKSCSNDSSWLLGLPTWYKYLKVGPVTEKDKEGKDVQVDDCGIILPQSNGQNDWGQTISRVGLAVIEILLRIGAMVSVGFVIYGGFKYILSQGEPDAIKKAQGTILNSVIGLVITIFATAIVNLVGGILF